METTLATILITIIGTLMVIGLGVIIWAIAQLNRRVSRVEGLGISDEAKNTRDIENIYREFEILRREHDETFKDFTNSYSMGRYETERRIEEVIRELGQRIDGVHHRIDRDSEHLERNLDKRFDGVYRKFYSQKLNSDLVGGLDSNN